MTANIITRRSAAAVTAAMVLGTAGPAIARPIGDNGPVPVAPPATYVTPDQPAHTQGFAETFAPVRTTPSASGASASPKVSHAGSGSDDLIYVVIGGIGVLVGGLGGVLASSSRRRPASAATRIAI